MKSNRDEIVPLFLTKLENMSYTCNSCNLVFSIPEKQKEHMKTEWHRYNLKRKVAQLPPINEELFNSKVASMSISDKDQNNDSKKQVSKKELRRRKKEELLESKRQILEVARRQGSIAEFESSEEKLISDESENTENQYNKTSAKQISEENTDDNSRDGDEEEEMLLRAKLQSRVEIPVTTCLFCHSREHSEFSSLEANTEHMLRKHGLYIPESSYLVDKAGLISYLGEKIGLGNVCLSCNYQGKDVDAVREHMLAKRHMRIPYESEDEKLEISEFYDFTSTYEPLTTDDGDKEWEDVSDSDESDRQENDSEAIYRNGHELILPSGAIVGHRSFARYYRQNLPPERILSEGQGTVVAAETRRLAQQISSQEKATQKRVWKQEKKRQDGYEKKNKHINFQPHFRDQLLQ